MDKKSKVKKLLNEILVDEEKSKKELRTRNLSFRISDSEKARIDKIRDTYYMSITDMIMHYVEIIEKMESMRTVK